MAEIFPMVSDLLSSCQPPENIKIVTMNLVHFIVALFV